MKDAYKNIVMPDYDHCILGTITSILKYYHVETAHKSSEKLDEILQKREYRNVIFLVLDGLGEAVLEKISPDGFLKQHETEVVTSVYPSTTTAALTTYYAGRPPYETGWIAWSQYFKEYGRAMDMLTHNESYYGEPLPKEPLMDVFREVVPYESVFRGIEKASPDVTAYEVVPEYSDRRSDHTRIGNDMDELIRQVGELAKLPEKKFILAYSDNPDGLLHRHGTASEEAKAFVLHAEEQIRALCESLGEDSVVIVSADHGHKDIEKVHTLLEHPEILECLLMPASWEARALTFWVKQDKREVFEERFQKAFAGEFLLLTGEEFLERRHMLGYGERHPKIEDFLGDYVALSVAGSMIRLETFLAEGKPVRKSTHCGLTREEMEVFVSVIVPKS